MFAREPVCAWAYNTIRLDTGRSPRQKANELFGFSGVSRKGAFVKQRRRLEIYPKLFCSLMGKPDGNIMKILMFVKALIINTQLREWAQMPGRHARNL